jgi:hypothetical protein
MTNRRKFIREITAAGITGILPLVLLPQEKLMQPIRLVVRADDMGISYDTTLAIIKAHREGIVTSASIMPNSQFFEESVQLCKANPSLIVGIHITLVGSRTRPVLSPEKVPSIVTPTGYLYESWEQLLNNSNPVFKEIEEEIHAQISKVRVSGLSFVHLDWHRGIAENVKEYIIRLCHQQQLIYGEERESMYGFKGLPLIPENWPRQKMPDGQIIYYAAPALNDEHKQLFFDRLNNIQPGQWIGVVHPGLAEPERASVTELLCSQKTKEIVKMKNIQLVSYLDIWKEEYGKTKKRLNRN